MKYNKVQTTGYTGGQIRLWQKQDFALEMEKQCLWTDETRMNSDHNVWRRTERRAWSKEHVSIMAEAVRALVYIRVKALLSKTIRTHRTQEFELHSAPITYYIMLQIHNSVQHNLIVCRQQLVWMLGGGIREGRWWRVLYVWCGVQREKVNEGVHL